MNDIRMKILTFQFCHPNTKPIKIFQTLQTFHHNHMIYQINSYKQTPYAPQFNDKHSYILFDNSN